jgi:hypothetical protein
MSDPGLPDPGQANVSFFPGEVTSQESILDHLPGWSEAQAIKAGIGELTDARMWRSLGWLLLGFALLIGGLMLWLKIPQTGARVALSAAESALP